MTGAAGTSVQWGAWGAVGGMATVGGDRVTARIEAMGLGILAPEDGLRALSAVLHSLPAAAASSASPVVSVATVSPLNFHRIGLVVRPLPDILIDIPEALAGAEAAAAAERGEAEAPGNRGGAHSSKEGGGRRRRRRGKEEKKEKRLAGLGGRKKGRSLESVLTSIRSIAQGLIGNPDLRDDEPLMVWELVSNQKLPIHSTTTIEYSTSTTFTVCFRVFFFNFYGCRGCAATFSLRRGRGSGQPDWRRAEERSGG